MAAGQGFKTFTSGEVLTAADVNGYLMQGVGVFTDAANRDAEITSPQEGQFAFLKDTNVTTYYTGSAWANLDTTGMTNPMTTTGDTIYSSPGSTPIRLGIGSTGNVLTVAGGVPTWAAPSSGVTNWTLLNAGGTALTGASSITISSIAAKQIIVLVQNASATSASAEMAIRPNNLSTGIYNVFGNAVTANTPYSAVTLLDKRNLTGTTSIPIGRMPNDVDGVVGAYVFFDLADKTGYKNYTALGTGADNIGSSTGPRALNTGGIIEMSAAITSMTIVTLSGTFDGGTIYVYGGN